MTNLDIHTWLQEEKPDALEDLYAMARKTREGHVGNQVHLRGRVDLSNLCRRRCTYCGIRAGNRRMVRYLMTSEEIMACAARVKAREYGTIVLQAGEDNRIGAQWMADLVSAIRKSHGLTVALSLGERPASDYRLWRAHGAQRYLLKFETSDVALYRRIHPPCGEEPAHRLKILLALRKMGYEIGSGIMVGLPGQTMTSVADDLMMFQDLDLDMVAIGPYIPHPHTPLAREFESAKSRVPDQVANSLGMACKVVALARLLCPEANIPATSALSCTGQEGLYLGLQAGANVIMPDMTPPEYEALYEIYPKPRRPSPVEAHRSVMAAIAAAGLVPAVGPGSRTRQS